MIQLCLASLPKLLSRRQLVLRGSRCCSGSLIKRLQFTASALSPVSASNNKPLSSTQGAGALSELLEATGEGGEIFRVGVGCFTAPSPPLPPSALTPLSTSPIVASHLMLGLLAFWLALLSQSNYMDEQRKLVRGGERVPVW